MQLPDGSLMPMSEQYDPAGHGAHWVWLLSCTSLLKVPSGHGRGRLLPVGQYTPLPHGVGLIVARPAQ